VSYAGTPLRLVLSLSRAYSSKPLLALPTLVLAFLALSASPALAAAPTWGIEMTHANAYGLQAASCPGGHESLPGEPDCGVDPYTGSGTTFARESGFNTYTIKVKNTASATLAAGATLACQHGVWQRDESTFEYRWLRNGASIGGAEGSEYTLTAEDEGKAIQCEVQGKNASYTTGATTKALAISPLSATALPALTSKVNVSNEGGVPVAVGIEQTCTSGEWSGSPTFSYQWLRNGIAVTGATSGSYTPVLADAGTAVQCRVTATNAGGSVAADNVYPLVVEPAPIEESELPAHPEERGGPTLPSGSEVTGPVTVADHLPEGLEFAGVTETAEASGPGWGGGSGGSICKIESPSSVTCTRSDLLEAGESYPPITLHVKVSNAAAVGTLPTGGVTNMATVDGGGASPASASASDPTTVAAAVPFGIQSFSTSVTDSLGSPFSQAAGHPFAASTTFLFNYTVNDEGKTETAAGTPKDIETELPPGFVGNPQNATKCPLELAQHTPLIACPTNTAIGFVSPGLGGNPIENGTAHPFGTKAFLVYILAPTPGSPAQFGFQDIAFFALNAKLRSDGDYGITVGDNATGRVLGRGLQSVSLTFCSYGVTDEGLSGDAEGSVVNAKCASPTAGVKPFLTNPAKCSGGATGHHAERRHVPGTRRLRLTDRVQRRASARRSTKRERIVRDGLRPAAVPARSGIQTELPVRRRYDAGRSADGGVVCLEGAADQRSGRERHPGAQERDGDAAGRHDGRPVCGRRPAGVLQRPVWPGLDGGTG
jgi:hypothetical protein